MKDIKLDDIISKVKAKHPDMPEKFIRRIIINGCFGITKEIKKGQDIKIACSKAGISLTVFKPHSNKAK